MSWFEEKDKAPSQSVPETEKGEELIIEALRAKMKVSEHEDAWIRWAASCDIRDVNISTMDGKDRAQAHIEFVNEVNEEFKEMERRGLIETIPLEEKIPFSAKQYDNWRKIRYRGRRVEESRIRSELVKNIHGATVRQIITGRFSVAEQDWIGNRWVTRKYINNTIRDYELKDIGKVIKYYVI